MGQQLPSILDFTQANIQGQQQGAQPLGTFPTETYGSQAPAPAVGWQPAQPQQTPAGQVANAAGAGANAYQLGSMFAPAASAAPAAAPMSFAPAGATAMTGGADAIGAGGAQAGMAPAAGMIGPVAAGAAGLAATGIARNYANQHGLGTPWAVANTMNPMNQVIEAPGAIKNAASGKPLGLAPSIALAAPTGGASLLIDPLFSQGRGIFGSSKGEDQVARDSVRHAAQDKKWFDENYQVKLASGQVLDMGKDGGYKYKNADGSERNVYNFDEGDPNAPQAIGWLRPLASILGEGNEKLTSDFVSQFYNELTKDGNAKDLGTVRARIIDLYKTFGLTPSTTRASIEEMVKRGLTPQEIANASFAAIDNLRPNAAPQLKPGEKPGQMTAGNPKDPSPKQPQVRTEGKPITPLGMH